MQANLDGIDPRQARRTFVWLSTGILLVVTLGVAWIGRGASTLAEQRAMAGLVALGTLAIGVLGSRATAYPRWAWVSSAAFMGVLTLASTLWIDPRAWDQEFMTTAWMLPWLLIVFGTTSARKSGVCAPGHPRSGWILVGVAAFVTTVLLAAPTVVDWIRN